MELPSQPPQVPGRLPYAPVGAAVGPLQLSPEHFAELLAAGGVGRMMRREGGGAGVDGRMVAMVVGGFVTVAAVGVLGPGLLAWYYFSRVRHVRAYLERTPGWIVEMQRAGVVV